MSISFEWTYTVRFSNNLLTGMTEVVLRRVKTTYFVLFTRANSTSLFMCSILGIEHLEYGKNQGVGGLIVTTLGSSSIFLFI